MGNDRVTQLVAEQLAMPRGLTRLQAHVLEQFTRAAALKHLMAHREDGGEGGRLVGAVLAARYRDCVAQGVDGAADVILVYLNQDDRQRAPAST